MKSPSLPSINRVFANVFASALSCCALSQAVLLDTSYQYQSTVGVLEQTDSVSRSGQFDGTLLWTDNAEESTLLVESPMMADGTVLSRLGVFAGAISEAANNQQWQALTHSYTDGHDFAVAEGSASVQMKFDVSAGYGFKMNNLLTYTFEASRGGSWGQSVEFAKAGGEVLGYWEIAMPVVEPGAGYLNGYLSVQHSLDLGALIPLDAGEYTLSVSSAWNLGEGTDYGDRISEQLFSRSVVEFGPVPEPGTIVALSLGLAALARRRRKA